MQFAYVFLLHKGVDIFSLISRGDILVISRRRDLVTPSATIDQLYILKDQGLGGGPQNLEKGKDKLMKAREKLFLCQKKSLFRTTVFLTIIDHLSGDLIYRMKAYEGISLKFGFLTKVAETD